MAGAPKTISDEKINYAAGMVKKVIEPRFGKIVDEFNKLLAEHGIRAGCEITWMFDEVEEKKEP